MGDKIDVLAVIDALVAEAQAPCIGPYPDDVLQLMQARAAIAELIEADEEYDAAKLQVNDETLTADEHHSASWPRLYAAQDRRAAALARVGGA